MIFVLAVLVALQLAAAVACVRALWARCKSLEQALLRTENPYAANIQVSVDREPRPAPPPAKKVIGR